MLVLRRLLLLLQRMMVYLCKGTFVDIVASLGFAASATVDNFALIVVLAFAMLLS